MVGGTVDFYVRDFPGLVRLSVAAARAFRSPALMAGAEEARFFVDLEALVGVPGSAEVTVEELLDESGEGEEMFSGTVLESCRYEISVEFSRRTEAEAPGQGRSIGRKLFQRLVALNTPMVYAVRDAEALAAEFSPGSGVRDFTPPVDITDESLKAESVLSSPVPRPSPGKPGPTAANVSFRVSSFGRLVVFEPLEGDGGAALGPIIELRSSPEETELVGNAAEAVVDYLSGGELGGRVDDPLGVIATTIGTTPENFTDQASCFLVTVGSGEAAVASWRFRGGAGASGGPGREVLRAALPADSGAWGALLRQAFGEVRGGS